MGHFMLSAFLLCLAGSILWTAESTKPMFQAKPKLEFQFGDLIRFKQDGIGFHYGVALGELDEYGERFFHKVKGGPYGEGRCVIGHLHPATISERRKDNYQDEPGHVLTENERNGIFHRLNECNDMPPEVKNDRCCGSLNLHNDNCEHTATYIRYGMQGRVSCQTKWPPANIGRCKRFKLAF